MEAIDVLRPLVVLAAWTFVMALWTIATRVPAMQKAGVDPQSAQDTSRLRELLPPEIQRVANNYNHLFEQPTVFYAVALVVAVPGLADPVHVACAWAFTILRIVHSCVQATIDVVMVRFTLFAIAWFVLAVMIGRTVAATF